MLQLSDFALALPSVYTRTDVEYILQSWKLCGVYTAKLMDEQRVPHEAPYAKIGLLKGIYARNISFVKLYYIYTYYRSIGLVSINICNIGRDILFLSL